MDMINVPIRRRALARSDSFESAPGAQQIRLRFIETRLCWRGRVNRKDLIEQFSISEPQASQDLSHYQKLVPGNIEYDAVSKTYRVTKSFKPMLVPGNFDNLLGHVLLEDGFVMPASAASPIMESLPIPQRAASAAVVRALSIAAQEGWALHIRYQSLTGSKSSSAKPGWRWVTPHVLANDGYRWHVRAWCHADSAFKDFVLGRIYESGEFGEPGAKPGEDREWLETVTVRIKADPALDEPMRKAIERDYAMSGGEAKISVRAALLFYFLQHLRLMDDGGRPEERQIRLINTEIRKRVRRNSDPD
jgi:hypothetical protein